MELSGKTESFRTRDRNLDRDRLLGAAGYWESDYDHEPDGGGRRGRFELLDAHYCFLHSARNAVMGLTRVARRAGIQQASNAAQTVIVAAIASRSGSNGATR